MRQAEHKASFRYAFALLADNHEWRKVIRCTCACDYECGRGAEHKPLVGEKRKWKEGFGRFSFLYDKCPKRNNRDRERR